MATSTNSYFYEPMGGPVLTKRTTGLLWKRRHECSINLRTLSDRARSERARETEEKFLFRRPLFIPYNTATIVIILTIKIHTHSYD